MEIAEKYEMGIAWGLQRLHGMELAKKYDMGMA